MEKVYPNHFVHASVAERYAASRPYFHPLVVERIRAVLELDAPLDHALDVGSGTGQSARALQAIARYVTATDPAVEMLSRIPPEWGLDVREGRGEALPVADGSCELVTAGLAFHWIKRAKFLPEVFRVLRPGGHLVIYNNSFSGRMLDQPDFLRWHKARTLQGVPLFPHYRYPLKDEQAERHGLHFVRRETYENTVELSREDMTEYILTQSNVIALLVAGTYEVESLRATLLEELRPLFPTPRVSMLFGGTIWYLRKPGA